MIEIVDDKSNYTFEQRIVLRVWKHEQPQTEDNESCVRNFPTKIRLKKTLP